MGLIRSVAETCFAEGLMHRKGWTELQSGVMWHGHIDDLARLVCCLAAHCTCGRPTHTSDGAWQCSAHRMLVDQHTLDHLAFARGMRQQFLEAEWIVEPNDRQPDLHPPKIRARQRGPRALSYVLIGLLVIFSLSAPLFSPSVNARPVAAWQTR